MLSLATQRHEVTERAHPAETRGALWACAAVVVCAAAFLLAAYAGGTAPFEGRPGLTSKRDRVERAMPFDTPLPQDLQFVAAGSGAKFPYHIEYKSPRTPAELGEAIEVSLRGSPKWELTQLTDLRGPFDTTLARIESNGLMTHFARMTLRDGDGGSTLTFDFLPMQEADAGNR